MHSNLLKFLMAAPSPQGEGAAGGPMSGVMSFLPFILIIAIFYFLIIRPQNKKQKETQKMLEAVKKGDKVVTIGGIHGVVSNVRDNNTVIVKVDSSTKIEFSKSAIASVSVSSAADEADAEEDGEKSN